MAQTIVQTNQSRSEIVGSAIGHSNNSLTLEDGEDFTVSYSLSSDPPTVTIGGTFKIAKTFDPATDGMTITPYFPSDVPPA